jgi:hypothetical protein
MLGSAYIETYLVMVPAMVDAMGLISKIFGWGTHPMNDTSTTKEWFAGLVLVLILAFMWSTVIRMIE